MSKKNHLRQRIPSEQKYVIKSQMTFCHLVLKLNTFHVCICNYVCVVVSVCISNYVCVVVSVSEYICEREGESCLMQTECNHLFSKNNKL